MFVKNIAMNIFTREVLKNSTITGNSSNRTKGPAKPKLDPAKMLVVRDIYRYYLAEHRKLPEKVINVKVDEYVEYIRQKIADLIRPPKKTPSEAAEATKDDKKILKKLPKARKGKQDISSSSESSDPSEDSEASDSEDSTN
ncbi:uncharacterized protein LOC123266875 [Cotesia glomerata]|uniref:uncharacterized protein LOC123266875 n=1 Tax=Cotesia glomerata TaxID=32391 RepID=UPI001D019813|nr:uncharacterized protein LOC123266875 [Cotesia glomerata]